jgi:hypothetical protein
MPPSTVLGVLFQRLISISKDTEVALLPLRAARGCLIGRVRLHHAPHMNDMLVDQHVGPRLLLGSSRLSLESHGSSSRRSE